MGYLTYLAWGPPPPCKQALGEERPQKCDVMEDSAFITSAEREVKVSRRSGMYQSCNFLTRLGMQSL